MTNRPKEHKRRANEDPRPKFVKTHLTFLPFSQTAAAVIWEFFPKYRRRLPPALFCHWGFSALINGSNFTILWYLGLTRWNSGSSTNYSHLLEQSYSLHIFSYHAHEKGHMQFNFKGDKTHNTTHAIEHKQKLNPTNTYLLEWEKSVIATFLKQKVRSPIVTKIIRWQNSCNTDIWKTFFSRLLSLSDGYVGYKSLISNVIGSCFVRRCH